MATWVRESYDLNAYCGGQVTVRFDYVTDDAYTRAGLCVDDLQVAALGWSDDSEQSEAGWRAKLEAAWKPGTTRLTPPPAL